LFTACCFDSYPARRVGFSAQALPLTKGWKTKAEFVGNLDLAVASLPAKASWLGQQGDLMIPNYLGDLLLYAFQ